MPGPVCMCGSQAAAVGWAEEGAANLHCSPGKDADSTSPLCPCLPLPRAQSQAFPHPLLSKESHHLPPPPPLAKQ